MGRTGGPNENSRGTGGRWMGDLVRIRRGADGGPYENSAWDGWRNSMESGGVMGGERRERDEELLQKTERATLEQTGATRFAWWREGDSNPQPADYDSDALPLSYLAEVGNSVSNPRAEVNAKNGEFIIGSTPSPKSRGGPRRSL